MCLSQIQLVPFLLGMEERKDTANDVQILQECVSTRPGKSNNCRFLVFGKLTLPAAPSDYRPG